jgi:2-polyprenyl-3-methyl-5-hydroxy-6-metoxy-1,4-benzoquinol methylase
MSKQEEVFKIGTEEQYIESISLGPWTSYSLLNDPKHMCFVLSRYKFCSKILEDKRNLLEIGCGDSFGLPIVAKNSNFVLAIDADKRIIDDNTSRLAMIKNIQFINHNICMSPVRHKETTFDGAFSVDVIEHLDKELEKSFMTNICSSLNRNAICVIGTPNIEANKYATWRSSVQHINLHGYESLKSLMTSYFNNVLMFSMNDEVVHTGYSKMSHYLFSIGIGVR